MNTTNLAQHIWKAEDYHEHSSAQAEAAIHLLKQIELRGDEHIVDVGCGDGKITALIAGFISSGSVLGIDASPEMIQFAQKVFPEKQHPNLRFMIKRAQNLDFVNNFDLLFSSFALQWVIDLDAFFSGAFNSLKRAGHLVATIPLGISKELELSIEKSISSCKWSSYFRDFQQTWQFRSEEEYTTLLASHNFIPMQINVVSQEKIFPSREIFEAYVIQWFPYLKPLPEHLRQLFFDEVIDTYFKIKPALDNGQVGFVFDRIDIIARAINL